jgi:hypothetical protein
MVVEESVCNIKLMRRPLLASDEGENRADGGGLHNRRERLPEIDTGSLSVAANNPTRFIPLERSVGAQLVFPYPFASNDTDAGRAMDKRPGVVVQQGIVLGLHGGHPVGVCECGARRFGYR